ncbi:hypothetical protein MOV08_40825 [Streptomyces yunnanensis]|uniref:Secreted protein n=1 Tax=Streptomyces yunnanensis TaxID=156453 RepID=A0ABY8AJF4_9ACTN|nr:hypothetical protein [Streptomyces yunnanensis]WEB45018.1 hypothetical protein MOV08_40825 [Streptomyces yunnanensis]
MVTARSPLGMRRTRRSAGPVRLLCLFAALLALVLMHGLGAESGAGHVSAPVAEAGLPPSAGKVTVATVPGGSVADPGQRHDERPDGHPSGSCLSGQPPQGAALTAPHQSPLDRCGAAPTTGIQRTVETHATHSMTPSQAATARTAVLLI